MSTRARSQNVVQCALPVLSGYRGGPDDDGVIRIYRPRYEFSLDGRASGFGRGEPLIEFDPGDMPFSDAVDMLRGMVATLEVMEG